jgi:predicted RNase H-like nuclease (RuvC/YqgF family)
MTMKEKKSPESSLTSKKELLKSLEAKKRNLEDNIFYLKQSIEKLEHQLEGKETKE